MRVHPRENINNWIKFKKKFNLKINISKFEEPFVDWITQQDLLTIPNGTITKNGVETNVITFLKYIDSWINGIGCLAINDLMEDLATAEISRMQLWQWLKHAKEMDDGNTITAAYYNQIMTDELNNIKEMHGNEYYDNGKFLLASEMFSKMISDNTLDEFLTLPAYKYI